MYKQDSIRTLVDRYRIHLTSDKRQRHIPDYRHYDYTSDNNYYHYNFHTEIYNSFTLELDEQSLKEIADKITEIDDLMRDPETAKLLMEARFINRLKRGF